MGSRAEPRRNSLVAINGPWTNSFSYFAVELTYLRRGPLGVRTVNWETGKCGATRDERARQVLHERSDVYIYA